MLTQTRRVFGFQGLAASAALYFPPVLVLALPANRPTDFREVTDAIIALQKDARASGRIASVELLQEKAQAVTANNFYLEGLPRLIELQDAARNQQNNRTLASRTSVLLSRLNILERISPNFARFPAPAFESVKAQYRLMFDSCVVRPEYQREVAWYASHLEQYRPRYEKLAAEVSVPWFVIGMIHALEASFNFGAHLHNGDPLTARTVHEPRGYPRKWLPPSDWESSAKDALNIDGFLNQQEWSLERILYRLESYNGFGYRQFNVASPYLWSFSTAYTAGKYTSDGNWSSALVSQQCGSAVMLKALVSAGTLSL